MRNHVRSLLAGAALFATVGIAQAQAGEPMALSESQMDQVTAGCEIIKSIDIDSFGGLKITFKNGDVLKAAAGTKFHFKV